MAIRPIPNVHSALADAGDAQHGASLFGVGGSVLVMATDIGNVVLVNAREYCAPFFLPIPATFGFYNVQVASAGTAGALVRCGIRLPHPLTRRPIDGPPLFDFGTTDVSSIGAKFTIIDASLAPGLYWLSLAAQGAPATHATLTGIGGNLLLGMAGFQLAGDAAFVGWRQSPDAAGSGPLPSWSDAARFSIASGSNCPRVALT